MSSPAPGPKSSWTLDSVFKVVMMIFVGALIAGGLLLSLSAGSYSRKSTLNRSLNSVLNFADRSTDASQETDFRGNCLAHNGRVYNAQEWGHGMTGRQLHCHADAHWSVDE